MKGAPHSPSSILRRIPYPVEPFHLELVPRKSQPPLLKGERGGLRQPPGLFDQLNNSQADKL
jgi:hypothetical protein